MVRPSASDDAKTKAKLDELAALGAHIVSGDLGDRASLVDATRGVEVVISALQGGLRSQSSLEQLERHTLDTKAANPDPMAIVPAAYPLAMLSGRAALRDLQNGRYPSIKPPLLRDHLAEPA